MRIKIIVFLVMISVCLCFSGSVLANSYSRYKGTWEGKAVIHDTTCDGAYKNGTSENLSLIIKTIKKNGKLTAKTRYSDGYTNKLSGKIIGHNIRFHYVMWGSVRTYDLEGTIKKKKMLLESFNENTINCKGGWLQEWSFEKK